MKSSADISTGSLLQFLKSLETPMPHSMGFCSLSTNRIASEQRLNTALLVMNIFILLVVVTLSQVYAYAQTYQIVYIKYQQFQDIIYISIELLKNS